MSRPLHADTAILLVDAQTTFLDAMHGSPGPVLIRLERLLKFAQLLELPVIATVERPVADKGGLPAPLREAMPDNAATFEKSTFDAMSETTIRAAVGSTGRRHIAVAGAETDVCVLLTVLALRAEGYDVFLLRDCVCSSTQDVDPALERMGGAGAIPTTLKTFCYELTGAVQDAWPQAWRERLAERPDLFPPPEDLPPRV